MEDVVELIPLSQFMARYSIGKTSVYKEVKLGRLRLTRRGPRTFVRRDDAQAWFNALPRDPARHGDSHAA